MAVLSEPHRRSSPAMCAALLLATLLLAACSVGRDADGRAAGDPSPSPSSLGPTPAPKAGITLPPHATHSRAAPHPPQTGVLPLRYGTGSATQVVTVVARSTASTTAMVQAWDKTAAGWVRHGPESRADIGRNGLLSPTHEGAGATPMGSFSLTEAFGRAGDPGTRLNYFTVDPSDYWVSDLNSAYYNTHYRCARTCPFDTAPGENLYRVGTRYTNAVVIDYNRFPVRRGAGSAFFLHVTVGVETSGCIAIAQSRLLSIMRWLNPANHPRIVVGVG